MKILSRIQPESQIGLEIGLLSKPIVTKEQADGNIRYVDYASAETLREILKDEALIATDAIIDVDLLWGDRTLLDLLAGEQVDYIIASYVIEHVPDMIGWLKELSEVLRDDGMLSLAIPDKRYTFDFIRELTSPRQLILPYLLQRLLLQLASIQGEVIRDWRFMQASPFYTEAGLRRCTGWILRSPLWYAAPVLGSWTGGIPGAAPGLMA